MNDYIIGHIRTFVPIAVGFLLAWLARELGVVIDETTEANLVAAVAGVLSAIYYALVRLLAERWPWVGYLLGVNKAPAYLEDEGA